jgi:hypothetical protein
LSVSSFIRVRAGNADREYLVAFSVRRTPPSSDELAATTTPTHQMVECNTAAEGTASLSVVP